MTPAELEEHIRTGIPLSQAMDFRVLELTPASIRVSGGDTHNVNVHGTAFAGSLFAICTLAAWGLLYSRLPADAALVMVRGEIDYLRPVHGEVIADCSLPESELSTLLQTLEAKGRARLTAKVTAGRAGQEAVRLATTLHVSRKS